MKKFFMLALVCAFATTLVGCGETTSSATKAPVKSDAGKKEEPKKEEPKKEEPKKG